MDKHALSLLQRNTKEAFLKYDYFICILFVFCFISRFVIFFSMKNEEPSVTQKRIVYHQFSQDPESPEQSSS